MATETNTPACACIAGTANKTVAAAAKNKLRTLERIDISNPPSIPASRFCCSLQPPSSLGLLDETQVFKTSCWGISPARQNHKIVANEMSWEIKPAFHLRVITINRQIGCHERSAVKQKGPLFTVGLLLQDKKSVQGRMLNPTPMTCLASRLIFKGAYGCSGLPVGTRVVPMFPATCPMPTSSAKCGCSFCVMRTA